MAGLLPLIALGVRRGLAQRTTMTDDGPETRDTRSGELHVAYQVLGDGPLDLVISPGWISHAERQGEQPLLAHYLRRPSPSHENLGLRQGARVYQTGQRGSPLKESMDDIHAVMDVAGSQRAAVVGTGVDPDRRTPAQRWGATLPRGGDLVRRQRVPRRIRRSSVLRRSALHAVMSASCPSSRRISA